VKLQGFDLAELLFLRGYDKTPDSRRASKLLHADVHRYRPGTGNSTTMRVPVPGVLSAVIDPP
jgi:hypothetical protein